MDKEPDRKQHKKNLNKFSLQKQISKIYIISLVCKIYIISLVRKVCCDSLPHIRNEAGFRGIKKGMVNVDNYENGVAFIHLINFCLT